MTSIHNRGAQIAYTDTGSGEPVVLIHCSASSGREWRTLTELLGDEYRLIAPDQWSCGQSDPWTGAGHFTLADEAAPVLDLIKGLAEPVHLVAHSYGGGVALHIARTHPHLVLSLTLIEPSAFHLLRDADGPVFTEISAVAAAISASVTSGDYFGGMEKFVDYWNGPGAWQQTPFESRIKLSQRIAKIALDFRALIEETTRIGDFADLHIPTRLLVGEHSPAPSRHIVAMLSETLPHAETIRIDNAGHMSPFTHAGEISALIAAHLDTVRQHELMSDAA